MDSSWTRVRQTVANRVLDRHLQDLQEQHVAMEMAHRQHVRHEMERERLAHQRSRTGSVQAAFTEPLIPTSRRQSVPVAPSAANRPLKRHVTPRPDNAFAEEPKHGGMSHVLAREETGGSTLLDMMASTLASARMIEEQRQSLYFQTPGPGTKTSGTLRLITATIDTTLPQPSNTKPPPPPPPLVEQRPKLEREKTFVKTEKSEVLSFAERGSLDAVQSGGTTNGSDAASSRKPKGKSPILPSHKTKGQRKGDAEKNSGQPLNKHDRVPGADNGAANASPPSPPRGTEVNVNLYEEDTGLAKDDGGFTPNSLALPLHLLSDETADNDATHDDAEDELVEKEEVKERDDEAPEPEKSPWDQARKCHYIRGYDPPQMRMPTDSVKFVFGDTAPDSAAQPPSQEDSQGKCAE